MKLTKFVILTAAWAALSTSAFAQGQAPPQASKLLTVDIAQTVAQAAMARCRADGYKVSVLVVDSLNAPMTLIRDDGANASTTEVAKIKATATIMYGRPSGPVPVPAGTPAPPPARPGAYFFGNGLNAQGAVPIMIGEMTIGAVAVSGAPGGDKDAACANAGIAKAADKLKP